MIYTTEQIPFSFIKLNGGLNTNGNPMNISDNEASDLGNIDFDKFGRFIKRRGYIQLNSATPVSPV